jgi:hypothetical protein
MMGFFPSIILMEQKILIFIHSLYFYVNHLFFLNLFITFDVDFNLIYLNFMVINFMEFSMGSFQKLLIRNN